MQCLIFQHQNDHARFTYSDFMYLALFSVPSYSSVLQHQNDHARFKLCPVLFSSPHQIYLLQFSWFGGVRALFWIYLHPFGVLKQGDPCWFSKEERHSRFGGSWRIFHSPNPSTVSHQRSSSKYHQYSRPFTKFPGDVLVVSVLFV